MRWFGRRERVDENLKEGEEEAQNAEYETKKQKAARLAGEMVELAQQLAGKAKELIKEVEESKSDRERAVDA
jgi:hypothetical protein